MRKLYLGMILAISIPSACFAQQQAAGTSVVTKSPEQAIGVATILPTNGVETIITSGPAAASGAKQGSGSSLAGSVAAQKRRTIDGQVGTRRENSTMQNQPTPVQNRPDGSWTVGSKLYNTRDGARLGGNMLSTRRSGSVTGNDAY